MATKSISIKCRGCKSGGRASKAAKPTSGDLSHVTESRLRASQGALTVRQESAEGVVVRGVGRASEAPQAERRGNG